MVLNAMGSLRRNTVSAASKPRCRLAGEPSSNHGGIISIGNEPCRLERRAQGLLVVQRLALDPLANLPGALHAADRRASFPSCWENRLAAVEKRAIAINDLGIA
jgi:hypothetical protein